MFDLSGLCIGVIYPLAVGDRAISTGGNAAKGTILTHFQFKRRSCSAARCDREQRNKRRLPQTSSRATCQALACTKIADARSKQILLGGRISLPDAKEGVRITVVVDANV